MDNNNETVVDFSNRDKATEFINNAKEKHNFRYILRKTTDGYQAYIPSELITIDNQIIAEGMTVYNRYNESYVIVSVDLVIKNDSTNYKIYGQTKYGTIIEISKEILKAKKQNLLQKIDHKLTGSIIATLSMFIFAILGIFFCMSFIIQFHSNDILTSICLFAKFFIFSFLSVVMFVRYT